MSNNEQSMKVFEIIAQIEELIETSPRPKLGGGGNKRLIDADEIYDVLGDLKVTIPDDIRKANSVMQDADKITTNAEDHAKDLVDETQAKVDKMIQDANERVARMRVAAEEEFEHRVSENEVYLEAKKRAQMLAKKAEYNAKLIFNNAQQYSDELLQDIQRFIGEYQNLIANNRKELNARKQFIEAQAAPEQEPAQPQRSSAQPAAPAAGRPTPEQRPAEKRIPPKKQEVVYDDEEYDDEDYDDEDDDDTQKKGIGGLFKNLFGRKDRDDDEYDDDEDYDDEDYDDEDDEEEEEKPKKKSLFGRKKKDDYDDEYDDEDDY